MRFGILTAALPGRAAFRYAFTPADVVWVARFIASTATVPDAARRWYPVWSLFERFASYADRRRLSLGRAWQEGLSFHEFMRRHMPSLPRTPWNELPPRARGLAVAATSGRLAGTATSGAVTVEPYGAFQQAPYSSTYPGTYASTYSPWRGEAEQFEGGTPDAGDATAAARRRRRDAQADAGAPVTPPPPSPVVSSVPEPPPSFPDPSLDAQDFPAEPPPDQPEDPGQFTAMDGSQLVLPPDRLRQWFERQRHHDHYRGYNRGYPPSPMLPLPYMQHRSIAARLAQLAQQSRRIGTLRNRYSGRRYPVFGGRVGSRNFRIVTRPRGGMHFEIMDVRSNQLESEQVT